MSKMNTFYYLMHTAHCNSLVAVHMTHNCNVTDIYFCSCKLHSIVTELWTRSWLFPILRITNLETLEINRRRSISVTSHRVRKRERTAIYQHIRIEFRFRDLTNGS